MRKKHEDEDDDEELHAGFGNSHLENKSSQQMTDERKPKEQRKPKSLHFCWIWDLEMEKSGAHASW